MSRIIRSPFVSALLGGALAAAAFLIFDGSDSRTTTVIQQAPVTQQAADQPGAGLTVGQIYKREAPGVVFIRAQVVQRTTSPFGLPQPQQRSEATGSGFVLDRQGYILTNAHVIDGAGKNGVSVSFEDKKILPAKVVGMDASNDLALLKVDPAGLKLAPLVLGDSSKVQVGDPAIAIGNPFGLDRTLTTGVVSALQREIQAPNNFKITNVIQTDAAINPGNSGGPLLDAAGRVIGINSQIATGGSGSGNVGIGFAVPINTAKQVIPELKSKGRVERGYLGISGRTVDRSLAGLNLAAKSGVLVQTVEPNGPADKAGIRGGDTQASVSGETLALGGDVIEKIDGTAIRTTDQLVSVVSAKRPGDTVAVQLLRDGKRKDVRVKLTDRPGAAPQP